MHADDGREYYAVSTEFDTYKVARNWWLMENVMTSIDHQIVFVDTELQPFNLIITDDAAKSRQQIANDIVEFVRPYKRNFEWWAWYGAYDHVALCQLFGKMIDLPKDFPMMTMDIKQEQRRKKVPHDQMPQQPEGKHNALADARWNKVRLDYLESL